MLDKQFCILVKPSSLLIFLFLIIKYILQSTAASKGDECIVKLLLKSERKLSIDAKDKNDQTALHYGK